MRIIVTGGAGFIGTLLARRLLAGPVAVGGAPPAAVDELVLADLVPPPADVAADPRVRAVTGDLAAVADETGEANAIFHLAGVVSGAAEADFDLGMHGNIDGTRAVLEHARQHRVPPVLVFSSSLAVFGQDPAAEAIGVVGDDTLPRPQSSYGVQKFIAEQLVADYTRKGFVRGPLGPADDGGRPAGQAQRRGVQLHVRDHPRAARGAAGDLPGAARTPRSRCPRRAAPWRGSCAPPPSATRRGAARPR